MDLDGDRDTLGAVAEEKKVAASSQDSLHQRLSQTMTEMVWQAGSQSAKKAWNVYGNIDILRPYFNVEPKEVQKRLLNSLIPRRSAAEKQEVPRDLYGPVMVVLTMIALLLYQMKTADHKVADGTLMGSAIGVCFTYWLGASLLVWFLSYVCSLHLTIVQTLSMIGYGMFGHCLVLFLGTLIHTSHDHVFFYFLWGTLGGLSTLRMVCIILSRVSAKAERAAAVVVLAVMHMLFLLYLHFAYHTIVEELSQVFDAPLVPEPENIAGTEQLKSEMIKNEIDFKPTNE